ncbi:hypothetical protein O9993_11160 [Vibrio lentus]|nr:hypothetical protein [Vibrio lentus]
MQRSRSFLLFDMRANGIKIERRPEFIAEKSLQQVTKVEATFVQEVAEKVTLKKQRKLKPKKPKRQRRLR